VGRQRGVDHPVPLQQPLPLDLELLDQCLKFEVLPPSRITCRSASVNEVLHFHPLYFEIITNASPI
jgi:hypothetical protein